MERTYVMIKADSYKRGLIGKIISRIEDKGYKITAMKMMRLDENILKEHYSHVADKPFFPEIVEYMISDPVVGMIVEGEGVIQGLNILRGPTKWYEANPGTIRGDYANSTTVNLMHCSESMDTVEEEIKRFFGEL